ncbi:bifunctional folylpolyglutamate synthase/dihydrofolate synthase [Candidatus Poribacteria bacterium]|nr:bifunctional folylpolyglutamate synthase/dihydrofolate synthase [Candidatus Poribacteria bacterium]MYK96668.1 bifunctional folylpolyglutamate synthase/dihydrofolate synthase [Candidatus Poribacteria bacterium]
MNYEAALAYIEAFIDYERSPDFSRQARLYNLNRISLLLKRLGNPHDRLRVIHIAGSKGKGSTAALVASVLTQAGYKTGLFTSPHLITPRERCRIDDELISEADVAFYIDKIKPAIETVSASEFGRVSFFEIYTALAFTYFADKATDFAVIEVGLGGRLDATNVVTPVATVITPISLEHTAILGETYTEIAAEKADIIKEGCPLVLAPQHPDARAVFEKVANERNVPIVEVKTHDVTHKPISGDVEQEHRISTSQLVRNADGIPIAQQFDVETDSESYSQLRIPLLGHHQFVNATTAIAAIECLKQEGYAIPKNSIYDGFKNVQWHGRIQRIMSAPLVVLDGAHSVVSMAALCLTLRESFRYTQAIFIVSLMRDKNLKAIGDIVSKTADTVIATQVSENPRVMAAEAIQEAWSGTCEQITICPNPEKAIAKALASASPTDLICITGSLYLVGQALKIFKSNFSAKDRIGIPLS